MEMFKQIIEKIINEQQNIIGPLAITQANRVEGLHVTNNKEIIIEGDAKQVTEALVSKYSKLFGKASIEICKEAVQPLVGKFTREDLPEILR